MEVVYVSISQISISQICKSFVFISRIDNLIVLTSDGENRRTLHIQYHPEYRFRENPGTQGWVFSFLVVRAHCYEQPNVAIAFQSSANVITYGLTRRLAKLTKPNVAWVF